MHQHIDLVHSFIDRSIRTMALFASAFNERVRYHGLNKTTSMLRFDNLRWCAISVKKNILDCDWMMHFCYFLGRVCVFSNFEGKPFHRVTQNMIFPFYVILMVTPQFLAVKWGNVTFLGKFSIRVIPLRGGYFFTRRTITCIHLRWQDGTLSRLRPKLHRWKYTYETYKKT